MSGSPNRRKKKKGKFNSSFVPPPPPPKVVMFYVREESEDDLVRLGIRNGLHVNSSKHLLRLTKSTKYRSHSGPSKGNSVRNIVMEKTRVTNDRKSRVREPPQQRNPNFTPEFLRHNSSNPMDVPPTKFTLKSLSSLFGSDDRGDDWLREKGDGNIDEVEFD